MERVKGERKETVPRFPVALKCLRFYFLKPDNPFIVALDVLLRISVNYSILQHRWVKIVVSLMLSYMSVIGS